MKPPLGTIFVSNAPAATILIRIMVGIVFFAEGVQKFLYPAELGAGRFAKIGIPWPEVMGPFVGGVETVCGLLVLMGLATRFACIPLVFDMLVAIVSTKIPILLGYGFWGFSLRKLSNYGLWSTLHESRTDLSMLLGASFLIWMGAGPWSLDARWIGRRVT
jgi:putative oxidoreductase